MRSEKENIIKSLVERISTSPFFILFDYSGMNAIDFQILRERLQSYCAGCHIAKNSYIKQMFNGEQFPDLKSLLVGQNAYVSGGSDVCAVAKVLAEFSKEFEKIKLKAGVLDGKVLEIEEINVLAKLPPRDQLLAQVLSVLQMPSSQLVRVLNQPGESLVRLIKAKFDSQ